MSAKARRRAKRLAQRERQDLAEVVAEVASSATVVLEPVVLSTEDARIFDIIEGARVTEDGKACVRKAREIAGWAISEGRVKIELLAEARQWLKLGLEHDKATDTQLLRDIKARLDEKDERRRELDEARAKAKAGAPMPEQPTDGET